MNLWQRPASSGWRIPSPPWSIRQTARSRSQLNRCDVPNRHSHQHGRLRFWQASEVVPNPRPRSSSARPPAAPRVQVTGVSPSVDCGRRPAKATTGEVIPVVARIFSDGRPRLRSRVLWRSLEPGPHPWNSGWLEVGYDDFWSGQMVFTRTGSAEFLVEGWEDLFGTWCQDVRRRIEGGMDAESEVPFGWQLMERQLRGVAAPRRFRVAERARQAQSGDETQQLSFLLDERLSELLGSVVPSTGVGRIRPIPVFVERPRALTGAWYEVFPRSQGSDGNRSGTLAATAEGLRDIAEMGFDVVYFPPIHPIGVTGRRGPNNSPNAGPDDPGSPWAIGAKEGGHMAIHPDLGTLEDFRQLLTRAEALNLEIALDYALQCSPDHPWVSEHPDWFLHRPDGSIRPAENPPKRYDDIYPLNFGCRSWRDLWNACYEILEFWIGQGVRIFRVDNPHTKPVPFWAWVVERLHAEHPEVVLLAEAFTRPAMMRELGMLGFSQSYTYFTWRTGKDELTAYLTELSRETVDYLRPNLFVNTPDILTEELQRGGPAAFRYRLVLAATLGANYGIYSGFELSENQALRPGSEEYLDSEKYQFRPRDLDQEGSLRPLITRVNEIRHDHPALQQLRRLDFHWADDPAILCYSKTSPDLSDAILVVVNLDPWQTHTTEVHLDLSRIGRAGAEPFRVRDLLTGEEYWWRASHNFVRLDPGRVPAHILWVVP